MEPKKFTVSFSPNSKFKICQTCLDLKILIFFKTAMSRSSYLRGKFHEKIVKINENSIFIFHFAWMFSWNRKNIVSRRITESGKLQTFSEKFEIKVQPVDQFSWIKFRGPIFMVCSLQSFSFVCLLSCSQSAGKVFPLEPHSEATRTFPGPKKKFRGLTLTPFICVPNFIPKY